jgi:hypothetical protein
MPRNRLTCEEKKFIKENAALGGIALAEALGIDRGYIYQYATDEGFSVRKGGKALEPNDRKIKKMRRSFSSWPRNYRFYKKLLVNRDGLRCHYCDVLMSYAEAQMDHIVAKARGGTDAPANLVLACPRCNNIKGTTCYSCPEFRNAIA